MPNLSEKDKLRVLLGNQLAIRAAWLIEECIKRRIPVFLENPSTSRLWIFPPIQKLLSQCSQFTVFDHCAFGGESKKPTKVAIWNYCSNVCDMRCAGQGGICSKTGKMHETLTGVKNNHFRTASASAYPQAFTAAFAKEFKRFVQANN